MKVEFEISRVAAEVFETITATKDGENVLLHEVSSIEEMAKTLLIDFIKKHAEL